MSGRGPDEHELRRRAEDGDVDAAFQLGLLHAKRGAHNEAVHWFQQVIDHPKADPALKTDAAYHAGLSCLHRGARKDAIHWLQIAADAGHAQARQKLTELGHDY